MKIKKLNIPQKLFDEYVKFRIHADTYLLKAEGTDHMSKYEIQQRWMMCVKKVMEIHREICKSVGVEYTTDNTDEFYIAFQNAVRKKIKLRG